jgi:hypothetical protein
LQFFLLPRFDNVLAWDAMHPDDFTPAGNEKNTSLAS